MRFASFVRLAVVPTFFLTAQCGGSSPGSAPPPDAGTPPPNGYPAPHPPFPQVTMQGGPILMSPQLVTVTFKEDDPALAARLHAFSDAIPSSMWWSQVTGDYGVGALTSATHVTVMPTSATSYTDSVMGAASSIEDLIKTNVADGVFPDPTSETVYLIYLPPNAMVSLDGQSSCVNGGFAGYHKSVSVTPKAGGAAVDASYAIVVRCSPPYPQLMMTEEAYMTISGSHELAEAATDGKPISQGFAWVMNDLGWGIFGPEVADVCADVLGTGQDQWAEGGFTYQRSWSNSNAKADKDPCAPIPSGHVYYNVAPQMGTVTLGIGGSATVELDAFSDAAMAAWQLGKLDVGAATANVASSLTLTIDKTMVQNGDVAHLDIKLDSAIPAYPGNFPAKTTVVYVVSCSPSCNPLTDAHLWPIVVQQQ